MTSSIASGCSCPRWQVAQVTRSPCSPLAWGMYSWLMARVIRSITRAWRLCSFSSEAKSKVVRSSGFAPRETWQCWQRTPSPVAKPRMMEISSGIGVSAGSTWRFVAFSGGNLPVVAAGGAEGC